MPFFFVYHLLRDTSMELSSLPVFMLEILCFETGMQRISDAKCYFIPNALIPTLTLLEG